MTIINSHSTFWCWAPKCSIPPPHPPTSLYIPFVEGWKTNSYTFVSAPPVKRCRLLLNSNLSIAMRVGLALVNETLVNEMQAEAWKALCTRASYWEPARTTWRNLGFVQVKEARSLSNPSCIQPKPSHHLTVGTWISPGETNRKVLGQSAGWWEITNYCYLSH